MRWKSTLETDEGEVSRVLKEARMEGARDSVRGLTNAWPVGQGREMHGKKSPHIQRLLVPMHTTDYLLHRLSSPDVMLLQMSFPRVVPLFL